MAMHDGPRNTTLTLTQGTFELLDDAGERIALIDGAARRIVIAEGAGLVVEGAEASYDVGLVSLLAALPTSNVAAPGIWNDEGELKVGTLEE